MKQKFSLAMFSVFFFVLSSCGGDNASDLKSFSEATREAFKAAVDASYEAAINKRGVSVAVYKDGYRAWTYAAGYADGAYGRETGAPMTADTPMYAYSITKTAVAALILTQIIDDNRYGLQDTVDDLLGGDAGYDALPVERKALINTAATVEELLTHTSGMPDYASNVNALIPLCDPDADWTPARILEDVVFLPYNTDAGYVYSNTNYILLGMIAERKGGAQLNDLLASTFFNRLGVDAVLPPQDPYPSGIAHPYDDAAIFGIGLPAGTFMDFSQAIRFVNPDYDFYLGVGRGTWSAGGIAATAENLAKWGYELYSEKGVAVSREVRTALLESAPLDGDYGYGVRYDDFTYEDGTVGGLLGHGGGAPGYRTLLRYETTKGIVIVLMANVNNTLDQSGLMDLGALASALLNAYDGR